MKETRGGKYGRNLAVWVKHTIASIPETERRDYVRRFVDELSTYSIEPRRKGQSKNGGCTHELSDLEEIDIENPEELARLVKEGLHLMYQKETSNRALSSLRKYLCDHHNV